MNKLNLSIIHWVKFLIKGQIKVIKKRLFNRLENTKDKNEEQLQANKDQGKKN